MRYHLTPVRMAIIKKARNKCWNSRWVSVVINPTSTHEEVDSIPGPLSGLRIWRCHGLWRNHRRGLDPALLWLWCRPAAVALIRPQPRNFYVPWVQILKKNRQVLVRVRKGNPHALLVGTSKGEQSLWKQCGGSSKSLKIGSSRRGAVVNESD